MIARFSKQHVVSGINFLYSWRKMEAATQDRAGWRQDLVCGLCSTGSDKATGKGRNSS